MKGNRNDKTFLSLFLSFYLNQCDNEPLLLKVPQLVTIASLRIIASVLRPIILNGFEKKEDKSKNDLEKNSDKTLMRTMPKAGFQCHKKHKLYANLRVCLWKILVEVTIVDHFRMLALGGDDSFRTIVYYSLSK